ncbi:centrin-1 [Zopfochytrium polystomum]|nr:centrin-1 [Zopfochytrium polystomum]
MEHRKQSKRTFQLSAQQEIEIREAFEMFDTDGSGSITIQEWRVAMRAMGFESMKEENRMMLAEMDRDNNGTIDFDEFSGMVKRRLFMKMAKQEMHKLFGLLCEGNAAGDKRVGVPNLRRMAELVGEEFSEEELREMIEEADRDNDTKISEDDFVRVAKRTSLYNHF